MQSTLPRLAKLGAISLILLISTNAIPLKRQSGRSNVLIDTWPAGSGTVGEKDPQTFRFEFDTGEILANILATPQLTSTGSSAMWVASPLDGLAGGYNRAGTFIHRGDDSNYVDGTGVFGPIYRDDVTIAGLTARDVYLIAAERRNQSDEGTWVKNRDFDGVMGMAYMPRSGSDTNLTGFFETLILQNEVEVPEFGFFFGRSGENGELTLGGRDSSKFKMNMVTAPVVEQGDWRIKIDGFSVGNSIFKPDGGITGKCPV